MPLFSTDHDFPARKVFTWVLPILFIIVVVVAIFYPKKSSPLEIIGYQKSECISEAFFDENNTKQSFDTTTYTRRTPVDAAQVKRAVVVAKIKNSNQNPRDSRETVFHMFNTGQVTLFQHLSASACLTEEDENDELYTADFKVVHSYCTQECIDEEYQIRAKIDKQTGEISIEPK